jgi:glycogen operon protein
LIALRRENPALRPAWFRQAPDVGGPDTVETVRSDGKPFEPGDWENPLARSVTFVLNHAGADSFAFLVNAADNGVDFTLPPAPGEPWEHVISSDETQTAEGNVVTLILGETSFTVLRSRASDS